MNTKATQNTNAVRSFISLVDPSNRSSFSEDFLVSVYGAGFNKKETYEVHFQTNTYGAYDISIREFSYSTLRLPRDYFSSSFNEINFDEIEETLTIKPTENKSIEITIHA
ncbi:hypothetical protein [Aquibacillus albus]|uniref:SHSP domain-containing protein n=1 Tax=Aquibacillus albus TaxID=1168171 RepID=A0ABS2MZS6_9BACI|nr:hypothetical protein [Aquibacillus albus]MBM7571399.1 hypothetical protein [Aquibacillus albus]